MEPEANTLNKRYAAMLATMGADAARHPLRLTPGDDGSAHVEVQPGGTFGLVMTERGKELQRNDRLEADEVLYRLARTIAAEEAGSYELRHRVAGQDSRRVDFAHRLELIGRISPLWRERLAAELDEVLRHHPYRDKARAGKLGREAVGILIIVTLVALWALAHWPLWTVWRTQAQLASTGVVTQARITDRASSFGRFANTYRISYRYSANGQAIEGTDQVDWLLLRRLEPLSTVDIRYDRASPDRSMIDGNERFGRLAWIWGLADTLIAFVLLRGWLRLRKSSCKT